MTLSEGIEKFLNLSSQKQNQFLEFLVKHNVTPTEIPLISNLASAHRNELSFAQERLWFLNELNSTASSYIINRCYRLKGNFQIDSFRKSIEIIVRKHSCLRSSIHKKNGKPLRLIAEDIVIPLETISLNNKSKSEIDSILFQVASEPLELHRAPLFRIRIFDLDSERKILLFSIHHIISDGLSVDILIEELAEAYNAIVENHPLKAPIHSFDYGDFINWQKTWFQDVLLDRSLTFWENKLTNPPKFSGFVFDFPNESLEIQEGETLYIDLSNEVYKEVFAYCKESKCTPFNLFLTLVNVLLFRYTENTDFLIGTPVSGRLRPELSTMVGLLINTIVLRNTLDPSDPFETLLQRVSSASVEAFEHQLVPFEKIVQKLKIDRELLSHPLFQIFFIYNKSRHDSLKLHGINWESIELQQKEAKFPITIEVLELESSFKLVIEYNATLYKRDSILQIVQHFQNLLTDILKNPKQKIADISFLLPNEKNAREKLNQTIGTFPNKPLHELISDACLCFSEKVAIECTDCCLTYKQLEEQSDRLAKHLLSLGLKSENRVGIYMNSSCDLITSLLGVLKAGCCYVPLDPMFPESRLKYILEQAEISYLISQSTLDKECFSGLRKISFEETISQNHAIELPKVNINQLAYILFTSGSTGNPKGVMVEHHSVVNALWDFKKITEIDTKDRWFSATTFTFDISVLEFFLPLLAGARLRIFPKETGINADDLVDELNRFSPTIIQGTPSLWFLLISRNWKPKQDLTCICGGEEMPPHLAEKLIKLSSKAFNVYGPTETTIWSTCQRLGVEGEVNLGFPIANTKLYVLNSHLLEVPYGVEGELFIGGEGVSRGYLNLPELTESRFIRLNNKERVFSTRDRVKLTKNGSLKFLGRADNQLKIRGYRVEPREIECVLEGFKGVERAIVLPGKDLSSNNSLQAFVATTNKIDMRDLQKYLEDHLPSYMIPNRCMIIDHFPLLLNGKIDQKALLLLSEASHEAEIHNEPITEIQKKIHDIWAKYLVRSPICIFAKFFDLGGHSILAVQVIDALNLEFNGILSLKILFKNPSIFELANYIEKSALPKSVQKKAYISADIENLHKPFPLTDCQRAYLVGQSGLLGQQSISSHLYREIQFEDLDISRLEVALNLLIQRHPAMRLVFIDQEQQFLQSTPYYSIKVSVLNQKNVRDEMSHQIFPAENWPLFDVKVTQLANQAHCIHFSISLLLADALSLEILMDELLELYQNPCAKLKTLRISFRDYVLSQKNIESEPVYARSKEYWHNRLESFPPGPQLPIKKPLTEILNPKSKRCSQTLDVETWKNLRSKAEKLGVTPNCLLISFFMNTLRRWSKDSDFAIALTLFNRPQIHEDINHIVGDFTTVSLLHVSYKKEQTFQNFATDCQEQLLDDLDHRAYSGIQFTQELLKKGIIDSPIPVVFTSLIGLSTNVKSALKKEEDSSFLGLTQTPQVYLDHQVIEYDGKLYLNWDFVEDVFPENLISIMFSSYVDSINTLLSPPDSFKADPLDEMKLKRSIFTSWDSKPKFLHEGVLLQAKQQPKAIGLVQGDIQLTYEDLVIESQKIKRRLNEVPSNSVVGILMDKCWQQIPSAMGILLSGCAFIPIDANYPIDRIQELLSESGCKSIIVTQFQKGLNVDQIIYPHGCENELEQEKIVEISPDQLAYIIYTSGSTGIPKGVMIQHKAVMNTILSINQRIGMSPHDVVYGISSFSFDLSIFDIFGTLIAGGKIVLPELNALKDPSKWLLDIKQQKITVWNSVPYILSMLTEHVKDQYERIDDFVNLKTIMLSGDRISTELVKHVFSIHPYIRLISLGGATEASIWSIWFEIPRDGIFHNSIPYGWSIENQQVLILNSELEENPIWAEGEIYIGGSGVAGGYWKNPIKTADQFINHPKHGRIFRTYDAGCYMPDGNIEFLGRIDRQVKVSGCRIELGEIESKLNSHPYVKQSTVIAINTDQLNKTIHAFVVLDESASKIESKQSSQQSYGNQFKNYVRNDLEEELENYPLLSRNCLDDDYKRRSFRVYSNEAISLEEFSRWLSCLQHHTVANTQIVRAQYGSAGGLYPVQVYFHIAKDKVQGITGGNYYYHPIKHQLIKINESPISKECFALNNQRMIEDSSFLVFLVANCSAIESIYNDSAALYCSLEAGLITQLLETNSSDTNIGLCQIGNTRTDYAESLFNLGSNSKYLHGLVGGYVKLEKKNQSSFLEEMQSLVKFSAPEKEMMQFLKGKLPSYMIPEKITVIPYLPVTNNGKIDYNYLTRIAKKANPVLQKEGKPNSDLYELLQEIWKQVLSLPVAPEISSNFFDIGGNSYFLIQLHNWLESHFRLKMPLVDLFRFSTIELQAGYFKNLEPQPQIHEQAKTRAEIREQSRRRQNE
jgi:amino acid adenylation domain-containing protein